MSNPFGNPSNMFGQQSTFGNATQSAPVFGSGTSSTFGQQMQGSVFGQQAQGPVFGQQSQTSSFGQFTSVSQSNQASGFGTGGFGSVVASSGQNPSFSTGGSGTSPFGAGGSGTSPFSTGTGASSFGTGAFGAGSGSFGSGSSGTSGIFGNQGTGTVPGFGAQLPSSRIASTSTVFGAATQTSAFSQSNSLIGSNNAMNTMPNTTSVFGGTAFTSTGGGSVFGGATSNSNRSGGSGGAGIFGTGANNSGFNMNPSSATAGNFSGTSGNMTSFSFIKTSAPSTSVFGGIHSSGGAPGGTTSSGMGATSVFGTGATNTIGMASGGFGGTDASSSGNKFMFNPGPSSMSTTSGTINQTMTGPSMPGSTSVFGSTKPTVQTDNMFRGAAVKQEVAIQGGIPLQNSEGIKELSPPASKFLVSSTGQKSGNMFTAGGTSDSRGTNVTPAATGTRVFGGNEKGIKTEPVDKSEAKTLFGKPIKREIDDGHSQEQKRQNLFGKSDAGLDNEAGNERAVKTEPEDKSEKTGLFGKPIKKEHPRSSFGKEAADNSRHTKPAGQSDRSRYTWRRQSESESKKVTRKQSDEGEEAPSAKRAMQSRQMSVDESKVAIACKNVPAKCNNNFNLRKHFSKYGAVSRIFPNPNRSSAVVHFKTHEDAAVAKTKGRVIERGLRPMDIFWSSYTPKPKIGGHKSSTDEQSSPQSSTSSPPKRPATGRVTKLPVKRQFKWARDEVDDELASMAGTSDIAKEQIKSVNRPGDSTESQAPKSVGHTVRRASPVPVTSGSESSLASLASSAKVDKESISKLTSSVSRNTSERLQTLTLRDKILRHVAKSRKQTSFIGACTDMCPERERYDREEKRRLHTYEILPGTEATGNPQVDHCRAVKEYSRSSADQEEPLPEELRTLPTLVTTMNYLLTNIADRGKDGGWGDWFDFLWDRTRGIRKEITQQQFCNQDTVELLEKCVRFHIFCAERLCEEDMHCFDAKINNENMTKCLQTLKEFYCDMEMKHNLFCPNEAEMRCYIVLMNLNQGDILRETQQLRPQVRNQSHIEFALQVHAALNSNNYVRFFRLVKNGSFLSACIMHRYFTQVRGIALNILMKAHRKGTMFPFDELVRILGFDDQSEARQFCEFYGLNTEEDCVILDKSRYIEPEDTWPPRRAPKLIESKRMTTIGEIMNGAPLPLLNLPQPTISFDQNGRFVGKVDIKISDLTDSPVKPKVLPKLVEAPVVQQVVPKAKLQFTNEDVKNVAKELFWEVIDETCKNIGMETMEDVGQLLLESDNILNKVIQEVTVDTATLLAQTVEHEAQVLRQKQQKAEREAMMNRGMVVIITEIIKEVTEQESSNMATAEVREIKAQLKKEQMERCTAATCDSLLASVVMETADTVANDVYQKDVVERLQQLSDIEKCVQLQVAGRYLQRWKREYAARLKMKRSMLEFPSAVAMKLPSDQIDDLIPQRRNDTLNERGFYIDQTAELMTQSPDILLREFRAEDRVLRAREIYNRMSHMRAWQPFDMAKVIGLHLVNKLKSGSKGTSPASTIYWKMVLSLPDQGSVQTDHQADTQKHLKKWLRAKFSKGKPSQNQDTQNEIVSLYKTDLSKETKGSLSKLAVCVRMIEGDVDTDKGMDENISPFTGTTGIIFVLPPAMSEDPELLSWQAERQRLDTLLHSKPANPALPMVVLCPVPVGVDVESSFLNRCLNLDEYFENEMLSDICIRTITYDEDNVNGVNVNKHSINEELSESLQWLADEFPQLPNICVKFLRDFVESFLIGKFYPPVLYNLKQRRCQGYLHQEPNDLVQLFNHLIDHLMNVAENPELQTQSWPVVEFAQSGKNYLPPPYWNNDDYQQHLCHVMKKLQLPRFEYRSRLSETWKEVCEDVWSYVRKVAGGCGGPARVDFVSKIRVLLNKVKLDFQDMCDLVTGESQCEPTYENMPWLDLICECINFKLANCDFCDPQAAGSENESRELMVVYQSSDLQKYEPPPEWKYLENDRDRKEAVSLDATFQAAAGVAKENKVTEKGHSTEAPGKSKRMINTPMCVEPLPETQNTANHLSSNLLSAVVKEQRESKTFEKFLMKVLDPDEETSQIPDISNLPEWSVFQSISDSDLEHSHRPSIVTSTHPLEYLHRPSSASGSESSEHFQRPSSVTDFLLNKTLGDYPCVEQVSESALSSSLTLVKEELQTHKRASDAFERKLQMWIEGGV